MPKEFYLSISFLLKIPIQNNFDVEMKCFSVKGVYQASELDHSPTCKEESRKEQEN